ncbi:DUF2064 domain-containing protein [Oscillochloris sp. ZM17-4]|uniref:TIGR04282 family arsenosugar biosynthesis glycosyltransferase n=1 Tax=Oscillochloris sp. ZM17-4 TaxID=2866714 RepID=UPI001C72F6A2|nr:DUF2064 domain-containing protein [Oscillochloris sp. ZM17-4]MBX0328636.1 DUF2064 domain-containing protein [Oscillochloris sp. ZM17-4]
MAHLLILLAHDPVVQLASNELPSHLGFAATNLYAAFLEDSVALAQQVARADVFIVAQHGALLHGRAPIPTGPEIITLADMRPTALGHVVARSLASGPVILFGSDMPHMPIWRLRDTLTYLECGADVVIGPRESGGWYLIGLRAAHPALLRALPGRDETPDDLCIAAATHSLRVAQIPAWYALDTLADLDRLAADLRTMPPDIAPHTRAMLNGVDSQARAVGG